MGFMKKVLHFNYSFDITTETFIRNIINHHIDFIPKTLALKKLCPFPSKFYYIDFITKIIRKKIDIFIKNNKFNIFHAHFGPWAYIAGKKIIPSVMTFYGNDISALAQRSVFKSYYSKVFKWYDVVLAEGPYMKQRIINLGCPQEKIKIQPIGIDIPEFFEKKANDIPVILFAARFVEKKGLIYFIKLINSLFKKHLKFKVIIIGDGEQKHLLSHIKMPFEYLGLTTYKRYTDILKITDILIQPSITASNSDSEGGAPTTIIEAAAHNVAVISTFHNDIPFIIKNNVTGLLCPEKDLNCLIEKTIKMLSSPKERRKLARNAYKDISHNHNILITTKRLEKIYKEILFKS